MGSLPHGWTDQTDAMNLGKYDKWLPPTFLSIIPWQMPLPYAITIFVPA